jgi:hypothetical protein
VTANSPAIETSGRVNEISGPEDRINALERKLDNLESKMDGLDYNRLAVFVQVYRSSGLSGIFKSYVLKFVK